MTNCNLGKSRPKIRGGSIQSGLIFMLMCARASRVCMCATKEETAAEAQ